VAVGRRYRHLAPLYDVSSALAGAVRNRAVAALGAARGDVVLDVGCGTGLNFPAILDRIGSSGQLVGVERSPDMIARAAERVRRSGWRNVTLIETDVADLDVDVTADAALLCLVHDVMRSRQGLERVVARLCPAGRIVAAGAKWAPWWAAPLNAAVVALNQPYVESFAGFDRPWKRLEDLVPDLRVAPLWEYGGAAYVATGQKPPRG
jgi:demethylmenaquinone methyltransferase/2-methoxy-6-polyprenyl-1,4-benzoquinol methylase